MASKTVKSAPAPAMAGACFADFTRFDPSMAHLMTRPMEAWLQWQADTLKAAEPTMMQWLGRRREANAAMLATIEKFGRCTDIAEALQIQQEWLDGVLKRMTADLQTLAEHAMTASQEVVTVTRQAAQSAAEFQVSAKPRAVEKAAEVEAAA